MILLKRYVLKVNDSSFVKELNWIIIEIPVIKTSSFNNALLLEESYLNEVIAHNGYAKTVTRKELIELHHPGIELVKVKVVLDEE